jgi:hypothetical protein
MNGFTIAVPATPRRFLLHRYGMYYRRVVRFAPIVMVHPRCFCLVEADR